MTDLKALYERAIIHHRAFETEEWLVPKSIPILYFGDIERYSGSRLKVVTVGLNPSYAEFGEDRFGIRDMGSSSPIELERSLSGYFKNKPYSAWFDRAYETLLQPLGASYYSAQYPRRAPLWWAPQPNTALHTDIGTPLATNPTWSKLPDEVRTRLQTTGFPLWRDLMEALEPTLILISVARRHLSYLGDLSWQSFRPFESSLPRHEMLIAELGKAKIVWGQSQVTPFFHLTNAQRRPAANAILHRAGLA